MSYKCGGLGTFLDCQTDLGYSTIKITNQGFKVGLQLASFEVDVFPASKRFPFFLVFDWAAPRIFVYKEKLWYRYIKGPLRNFG